MIDCALTCKAECRATHGSGVFAVVAGDDIDRLVSAERACRSSARTIRLEQEADEQAAAMRRYSKVHTRSAKEIEQQKADEQAETMKGCSKVFLS